VVEDVLRTNKAAAVWFQLGCVSQEAAQATADAGLAVVMDRCIRVEHSWLVGRS
jgi:predicted CoA-binding protein